MHRGTTIARTSAIKSLAGSRGYVATTSATPSKPLTSILIANRGEIALRVNKTASQYGIKTTTIYTDPDRNSQHALSSPYAINLGPSTEYLNGNRIIEIAKQQNCVGIHPGYGFLSENSTFARNCVDAGLTFIGPPWQAMEAMGNKSRSKEIMNEAGVPCIPGYHGKNQDPHFLLAEAEKIGFPVLLKAVKGGGGKGMRIAMAPDVFFDQLKSAKSEAMSSFGDEVMLVEKYIQVPRHIEVQVFADKYGNCVALGERDCSIQRRHQKILEESPAPNLDESVRQDLYEKARAAALAVGYEGAGTVEFIFDNETGSFFFMEMNTRLQVEHPVTEMITGEDLVRWQIIVAEGGELPLNQARIEAAIAQRGHAIEARIYAEDPSNGFIPSSGTLTHLRTPQVTETVRIDAGFIAGDEISPHYDPMIAKLIVRGESRAGALTKMHAALEQYEIAGVTTNIEFLKRVVADSAFKAGELSTNYITQHAESLYAPSLMPPELHAQAALGLFHTETVSQDTLPIPQPGFNSTSSQSRTFAFLPSSPSNPSTSTPPTPVTVTITQNPTTPATYTLKLPTDPPHTFTNVTSTFSPTTNTLTTHFPHTLLTTRFIAADDHTLTLFQQGRLYSLQLAPPAWAAKALGPEMGAALGVGTAGGKVVAPMPCKVHSVAVAKGDRVVRGQVLVVIESMKMETAIQSPVDGVVGRVVLEKGDLCKAGGVLVEVEQDGERG